MSWPNVSAVLHRSSPELDSVKHSSSTPFILSAVICTWVPGNEQAEGYESPWPPCGCIGYMHVGEISHDLQFHLVFNYLCISQLSPSSWPLWIGTSTVSVPSIGQYLQNENVFIYIFFMTVFMPFIFTLTSLPVKPLNWFTTWAYRTHSPVHLPLFDAASRHSGIQLRKYQVQTPPWSKVSFFPQEFTSHTVC